MKRVLPILAAVMILFCGCKVKTGGSEPLSPEELVEAYYTCLINENYDMAYEKYYSNISKALISEEEYVSRTSEDIFTSGRTITDILVQEATVVEGTGDDTIYKVSGLVKFISNDTEDTDEFYEYVIVQKETNFYRILHKGYLSYKVYTMPTTTEQKFHGVQCVVYNTAEGRTLEFTVRNDTAGTISIGKGDKGPLLELEAQGMTYPYRYEEPVKLKPGEEATIVGKFYGFSGSIEKITLSSIYSVGQDDEVIEGDGGRLYSVSVA